jgi:outer membrane protein
LRAKRAEKGDASAGGAGRHGAPPGGLRPRRIVRAPAAVLALALCRPLGAAEPFTLEACFELARARSESLRVQEAEVGAAEARRREALGGALPRLGFFFNDTFQDAGGQGGDGEGNRNSARRERPEAGLRLSQPLFSGFRESRATAGFAAAGERERWRLERAARLLFLDVARAFYAVILYEADLEDVRATVGLSRDRVKELEERVRLGKTRESELLSAESQLASLRAEESESLANLRAAREELALLTGRDFSSAALEDRLPRVEGAEPLPFLLEKTGERADVKAQRAEVEARRRSADALRGAYWPSADVRGNYYVKRTGFQEPIDWDVVFSLDVPLYQGGSAAARTRQAVFARRQAEWELERLARAARSEAAVAHSNVEASVARSARLEEAAEKAEKSYRLLEREYRRGLANNLELLQALDALARTRRDFHRALVQGKLDWIHLKVATEELP